MGPSSSDESLSEETTETFVGKTVSISVFVSVMGQGEKDLRSSAWAFTLPVSKKSSAHASLLEAGLNLALKHPLSINDGLVSSPSA
jgi:hypothetical protein